MPVLGWVHQVKPNKLYVVLMYRDLEIMSLLLTD